MLIQTFGCSMAACCGGRDKYYEGYSKIPVFVHKYFHLRADFMQILCRFFSMFYKKNRLMVRCVQTKSLADKKVMNERARQEELLCE